MNDFLIATLQQVWTHFMTVIGGSKELAEMDLSEVYGEESIVLHSIVRILNHIVVRVVLADLSEASAMSVLSTAMAISTQALLMSQKNIMLCDSSISLLLSTMRVLCNEHFVASNSERINALGTNLMGQNQESILHRLLPLCAKLATEDEMPGKQFALVEELLMALSLFTTGGTSANDIANTQAALSTHLKD